MAEILMKISQGINVMLAVCYVYQLIYIILSLFARQKPLPEGTPHRFAVLICARNEEKVIGNLIESIRQQTYPAELVTVFVAADNCTDGTAACARALGAVVWERHNLQQVGKGYALEFLLDQIKATYGFDAFDGYFVVDADNLLEAHFIEEMNRNFSAGQRVITSYRNSKNCDSNWIAAQSALCHLREARQLNYARMLLGVGCLVCGTGFLVHKDIIKQNDGWHYFLLTEDTQFTMELVLRGERVTYCDRAELFDEQPITWSQCWNQRLRWVRGYFQVFRQYAGRMFRKVLHGSFTAFDMLMSQTPALCGAVIVSAVSVADLLFVRDIGELLQVLFTSLSSSYALLLLFGSAVMLVAWKKVHASAGRKLFTVLTFPLFVYTFIPITVWALLRRTTEWKPIEHTVDRKAEEMQK